MEIINGNQSKKMKKIVIIFITTLLLTSCYEDYVKDYYYSAAYVAYQYDLRTFVIGETDKFDISVALAGVIKNDKDRQVNVVIDDSLVMEDISGIIPGSSYFTAFEGMMGKAPFGDLSQGYVTDAIRDAGVSSMSVLPKDYYTVEGIKSMKFVKGSHNAFATIKATDKIKTDPNAFIPYYAIGYRITSADVDTVITSKSFGVVAVRCENKFYGNWYHGGKTLLIDDASSEVISEDVYPFAIPQSDERCYELRTVNANTVITDKVGTKAGKLHLVFDGSTIKISSADGSLPILNMNDAESTHNEAKLLQDREIYLNYKYSNGDGTSTIVSDTLYFRNRIRDGINEWQDENPKNYN